MPASLKTILKSVFFLNLALVIFLFFYKPTLPKPTLIDNQILSLEPVQTETNQTEFTIDIEGFTYHIEPKYDYEIYGLVVEEYDARNLIDFSHKNDPGNLKDLCLVWGKTIANDSYREVKYSHGEFTCYYSWRKPLTNQFYPEYLSNNHLLPASSQISQKISNTQIGDQLYIKGKLVNYSISKDDKPLTGTRRTSVDRADKGNGACEVIYVEDLEVIKKASPDLKTIKFYLNRSLLVLFLVSLITFFII